MQFTNIEDLHIKILYLQCVPAAAAAAEYTDIVNILVPQLEHLGRSEDQPEEVKLEVAIQIAALGMCIQTFAGTHELYCYRKSVERVLVAYVCPTFAMHLCFMLYL